MTTFILPVVEIEQIIKKLTALRDKTVALSQFPTPSPIQATVQQTQLNDYEKVDKMIDNWKTILTKYRSQTGDLTTAFEKEMKQYNEIVNSFHGFLSKQDGFAGAGVGLQSTIKGLTGLTQAVLFFKQIVLLRKSINTPAKFLNNMVLVEIGVRIVQQILFLSVQSDIRIYCDYYIKNWNSFKDYGNNVCNDFHNNKWNDFANFFTNACQIKISFDTQSSDNEDVKSFYGMLCTSSGKVDVNKYPKGVENSGIDQTLFQFLQSKKSFVTYGAQTSTSLTWTSTISSALTHTTKFSNNLDNEVVPEGELVLQLEGKLQSKIGFKISTSTLVTIGQASSQTETTVRTVVINLGDPDQGKVSTVSFIFKHIKVELFNDYR